MMTSVERQIRIDLAAAYRARDKSRVEVLSRQLSAAETDEAERLRTARDWHNNLNRNGPVVYFIRAGATALVKIGFSGANVVERLRSLQTSNPEPLLLVGLLSGSKVLEKDLHRRFDDNRRQGEWFELDTDLQGFIDTQAQAGRNEPVRPPAHEHFWTPAEGRVGQYLCRCGLVGQRILQTGRIQVLRTQPSSDIVNEMFSSKCWVRG